MNDTYRRLAVFVDCPSEGTFLWVLLESADDPAVWLDLETAQDTFPTWIEAYESGNDALRAYVEDETLGPTRAAGNEEADADDESS
jgi:hypothetical protein